MVRLALPGDGSAWSMIMCIMPNSYERFAIGRTSRTRAMSRKYLDDDETAAQTLLDTAEMSMGTEVDPSDMDHVVAGGSGLIKWWSVSAEINPRAVEQASIG